MRDPLQILTVFDQSSLHAHEVWSLEDAYSTLLSPPCVTGVRRPVGGPLLTSLG